MYKRQGSERSELGVVCDQIGTPTYALDLAEAIYTILTARQWVPGIYHFSDEGVCSWYDFTKAIHRIAGIKSCNVKPIATDDYPTLAARPPYSVLDKTRIKKTCLLYTSRLLSLSMCLPIAWVLKWM